MAVLEARVAHLHTLRVFLNAVVATLRIEPYTRTIFERHPRIQDRVLDVMEAQSTTDPSDRVSGSSLFRRLMKDVVSVKGSLSAVETMSLAGGVRG